MEGQNELPWITNPFRLWSLEDMRRVFADLYLVIGQALANIEAAFKRGAIDSSMFDSLREIITKLKKNCEEVGLRVSPQLLADAIKNLPQNDREFAVLINAVIKEIGSELFFHIPYHRAIYYNRYEIILRNKAFRSFPTTIDEIINAGNCYATGQYTGCVFHSMRAAEIGLRVFGLYPFLNITFNNPIEQVGWAEIIKKIEAAVKAKVEEPKTLERDEELRFCSEAAAQFRYFNLGWRVFSAHARQTYGEDSALKIMEAVTAFLEALSVKVSEPIPDN